MNESETIVVMSKHQKPFAGRLSTLGKYTIRLDLVENNFVVICTRGDCTTVYRRLFNNKEIDQANKCFNDVRLLTEIKITLEQRVNTNWKPD